jgi:phosphoribosyl 1,2-cyclic phosphodiesterase
VDAPGTPGAFVEAQLRFATLGSGSRGNATLVECAGVRLLVDCGLPLRELKRRLGVLGVEPEDIAAVLLTHEHGDHVRGLAAFAARCRAEVWATPGTWKGLRAPELKSLRLLCPHGPGVRIGGATVLPYPVPHDAREPVQYAVSGEGRRLGILTDSGSVTPHALAVLGDCDALILECNHDEGLLHTGPYPPALRRRVGGPLGHLSNVQAAGLLAALPGVGPSHLTLAHLSETNNRPELALAAVAAVCGRLAAAARVGEQDRPGPWVEV